MRSLDLFQRWHEPIRHKLTPLENITAEALKGAGGVTAMWNATKTQTQNYLARRERVYKAVLALNLRGIAKTPGEIAVDNAIADGVLTDRTHGLGVLSGTIKANPEYIKIVFESLSRENDMSGETERPAKTTKKIVLWNFLYVDALVNVRIIITIIIIGVTSYLAVKQIIDAATFTCRSSRDVLL